LGAYKLDTIMGPIFPFPSIVPYIVAVRGWSRNC